MPSQDHADASSSGSTSTGEEQLSESSDDENSSGIDGSSEAADASESSSTGATSSAEPSPCDLFAGCLPSEIVVHVDGDGGQDETTISKALARIIEAGARGTIILHERQGAMPYYEAISAAGDEIMVAIVAAPDEHPIWTASRQLTITRNATFYLEGVMLQGNPVSEALRVDGGRAWLERCRVTQNARGIVATRGAALTVRNSFVSGRGDASAIMASNATVDLVYSTLGNTNFASLTCDESSIVTIRNAVVLSEARELAIACTPANVATSFVSDATTDTSLYTAWFQSYELGNFTVRPWHPFWDVAVWRTGDPRTDIDGDFRPIHDGLLDTAGADLVQ